MPRTAYLRGEKIVLMNLQETACFLGVCERTARKYIHDGLIPSCKIRRRLYCTSDNLAAFLKGAASTRRKSAVEAPCYDVPAFNDAPPDIWEGE